MSTSHEFDPTAADLDSPEEWDRRYADTERWWSGAVNHPLTVETTHLTPGTALDVGCGEGADAIWLAERGWRVTASDISAIAADRVRHAAADAGVDVDVVVGDIARGTPSGAFDLVTLHYPALRHSPDDAAISAILAAVAPGGTLLVVGHDMTGHEHHLDGRDVADYVQPPDFADRLDDGWDVEVNEIRPRVPPPGHQGHDAPDVVLRARRR